MVVYPSLMPLSRYSHNVRFLYQYPEVSGRSGEMLAAGRVTDVARAVQEAGLHGLGFTEHPAPSARWLDAGGHQTLDPFVALAQAAAVTHTIRLITYLTVLPYRNPFLIGKTAATLDLVSQGRLTLGVGAGYQRPEFRALGVDFEERNALFDEAMDILPRFWSGAPVTHSGLGFEARDIVCRPLPVQRPIPLWVGGNSQVAMKRAASVGQGWMPMLSSAALSATTRTANIADIETLALRIRDVKELAGDRGRELDFLVTYPDPSINVANQEVEQHRDVVGRLAQAGITWLGIPGSSRSWPQTQEIIGSFAENFTK